MIKRQPGEEVREHEAIAGSPEEIVRTLLEFAEVGVKHLMVVLDPSGIVEIERFGRVLSPVVNYSAGG